MGKFLSVIVGKLHFPTQEENSSIIISAHIECSTLKND